MRDYEHHLFYGNDIAGDGVITLDRGEANHAASALRVAAGEPIRITDGAGTVYDCQCADISRQSMTCRVLSKTRVPRLRPELTMLVGLPDKEHFETILEHATALGVANIVPLVMDHCRKPWWGSWEKLRERFTAKTVVSMKQCLYPYIPRLEAPAPLDKIIVKCEKPIILADQSGTSFHDRNLPLSKTITCLIGPPGGLSVNESNLLEAHGSLKIKIAQTRLRTELAAAVMCSRIMGCRI